MDVAIGREARLQRSPREGPECGPEADLGTNIAVLHNSAVNGSRQVLRVSVPLSLLGGAMRQAARLLTIGYLGPKRRPACAEPNFVQYPTPLAPDLA